MSERPPLAVESVSFSYDANPALADVSLTVHTGSFVGLIGPNGSGKSTLLRICVGLLRPTAGRVDLFGEPIERFRHRWRVGYVPQRAAAASFPATVEEVVAIGRTPRRGLLRRLHQEDRTAIDRALAWLSIAPLRRRLIGELSGGEYQRVMVARALAGDPDLIFLDEPGAGLDVSAKAQLLEILKELCESRRLTVVYVSHDLEALHPFVSHVALLNRRLRFFGTPDALQERQDLQNELHEAAVMADHYANPDPLPTRRRGTAEGIPPRGNQP